mgnify:CR=1 FL=1
MPRQQRRDDEGQKTEGKVVYRRPSGRLEKTMHMMRCIAVPSVITMIGMMETAIEPCPASMRAMAATVVMASAIRPHDWLEAEKMVDALLDEVSARKPDEFNVNKHDESNANI